MPAKAYTDPTILSKWCPKLDPTVWPQVRTTFGVPVAGNLPIMPNNLTMFPGMAQAFFPQHFARVPAPPMGRQIVLTFPSIYRERSPDPTGRVFPTGYR